MISTLTSLGGYILAFILLGMFLDNKFFGGNGIAVIVSVMVGILFVILGLIRMVKDSNDSE